MAAMATFKVPAVTNEPNVRTAIGTALQLLTCGKQHFAKGSAERDALSAAVKVFKQKAPLQIPAVVGGKEVGAKMALYNA
jgi:1-pyrroline-5-carboxylate dehydrogenase